MSEFKYQVGEEVYRCRPSGKLVKEKVKKRWVHCGCVYYTTTSIRCEMEGNLYKSGESAIVGFISKKRNTIESAKKTIDEAESAIIRAKSQLNGWG